jgi:hypothetical protein
MKDLLTSNLGIIVASISTPVFAIIIFVVTKKKYQGKQGEVLDKQNEAADIDMMESKLAIYKNLLDDVEARYEIKIAQRDSENLLLEAQIGLLQREIEILKEEIASLTAKL